jgi:hypothetical protein
MERLRGWCDESVCVEMVYQDFESTKADPAREPIGRKPKRYDFEGVSDCPDTDTSKVSFEGCSFYLTVDVMGLSLPEKVRVMRLTFRS